MEEEKGKNADISQESGSIERQEINNYRDKQRQFCTRIIHIIYNNYR